jgi:hypothetical protein
MKSIKLVAQNATAVEAALAAVNGKASAHSFYSFEQVAALAARAEAELDKLRIQHVTRAGAKVNAISGKAVSKSYRYARNRTRVQLERRNAGWYITDTSRWTTQADVWGYRLILTKDQDTAATAAAVAAVRSSYSVAAD